MEVAKERGIRRSVNFLFVFRVNSQGYLLPGAPVYSMVALGVEETEFVSDSWGSVIKRASLHNENKRTRKMDDNCVRLCHGACLKWKNTLL